MQQRSPFGTISIFSIVFTVVIIPVILNQQTTVFFLPELSTDTLFSKIDSISLLSIQADIYLSIKNRTP